eukprot:9397978-Alexandrium_andersonii.AAC.1
MSAVASMDVENSPGADNRAQTHTAEAGTQVGTTTCGGAIATRSADMELETTTGVLGKVDSARVYLDRMRRMELHMQAVLTMADIHALMEQ